MSVAFPPEALNFIREGVQTARDTAADRRNQALSFGNSLQSIQNATSVQNPQDQALIDQILQNRFRQSSQLLQEQFDMLSGALGSSAAARGVARGGIGLAQQVNDVFNPAARELANLQLGLQTAGLQQQLQLPFQRTQLALGLYGQQSQNYFDQRQLALQRRQQRGGFLSGIGSVIGTGLGALAGGPFGGAFGNWLFGQGGG